MTGLEVTLIIIGCVLLIGSFFVSEKLSTSDIRDIQKLSEKEMKLILEKEMEKARGEIEQTLEEQLDKSFESLENKTDKETNEKIMAISEYSDTVLDSMNKSHNEVMFMYSMLNDKQEQLKQLTEQLEQMKLEVAEMSKDMNANVRKQMEEKNSIEEQIEFMEKENPDVSMGSYEMEKEIQSHMKQQDTSDEEVEKRNANEEIIRLHQQGLSQIEIAKQLGRGLGEVKLVLGLFNGEA